MSAALRLREDYDAQHMRALAKASRDATQTRRLLALAAIYDGASRAAAAVIGGVVRHGTVEPWSAISKRDTNDGFAQKAAYRLRWINP